MGSSVALTVDVDRFETARVRAFSFSLSRLTLELLRAKARVTPPPTMRPRDVPLWLDD